jgi:hypothetical protein
MTKIIVATASVCRRDSNGYMIDYFGEGGVDYLQAFTEGTTDDAVKAHMLDTLNARITAAGFGPEHAFTLDHMGYEEFEDESHIDWQFATVEVL